MILHAGMLILNASMLILNAGMRILNAGMMNPRAPHRTRNNISKLACPIRLAVHAASRRWQLLI